MTHNPPPNYAMLFIITPPRFGDTRGWFQRNLQRPKPSRNAGITADFRPRQPLFFRNNRHGTRGCISKLRQRRRINSSASHPRADSRCGRGYSHEQPQPTDTGLPWNYPRKIPNNYSSPAGFLHGFATLGG